MGRLKKKRLRPQTFDPLQAVGSDPRLERAIHRVGSARVKRGRRPIDRVTLGLCDPERIIQPRGWTASPTRWEMPMSGWRTR